jgi:SAM-dependent methyltransferase
MSIFNDLAIESFLKAEFRLENNFIKGTLLDLGCGRQPYRVIYDGLFKTAVAADFNVRSSINVQLDAHLLPFSNNSFDVILFSEVVEHVHHSNLVLIELARIMKPGGLLLLTWPFMYPLHELPYDFCRYTEQGMNQLIEESGLRIEKLVRRGDLIALFFSVVEEGILNVLELLSRIPLIGITIFGPLKKVVHALFMLIWHAAITFLQRTDRANPSMIGDTLKGTANHLAIWTLGYCARVRKTSSS